MNRRHLIALLVAGKLALLTSLVLPPLGSAQTSAAPGTTATVTATTDEVTAIATFRRAGDGDDAAIEPALAQLAALNRARPLDPLWMAYAGAATSMQARTTWRPWTRMRHTEDGLAMIDKALALLTPAHEVEQRHGVPVALQTRLTAAGTFLALPSMFNRGERGRRLVGEVMQHPAFATTPTAFQDAARKVAAKAAS